MVTSRSPNEWALIDKPLKWRSFPLVAGAAYAASIPWAVLHGPVEPEWVAAQALGAAVVPMVAGWVTLWRTRGDLRGALRVTLGVVGLLLALQIYSLLRTSS